MLQVIVRDPYLGLVQVTAKSSGQTPVTSVARVERLEGTGRTGGRCGAAAHRARAVWGGESNRRGGEENKVKFSWLIQTYFCCFVVVFVPW